MRKKIWTHKKYKGREFSGRYKWIRILNERVFILTPNRPGKVYSFESHQAAKKAGFEAW